VTSVKYKTNGIMLMPTLNSLAKLKLLTTEKLGEGKKAGLLYLKNKQNIWLLLAKYYFKRNSQKLVLLGLMKLQHDRA